MEQFEPYVLKGQLLSIKSINDYRNIWNYPIIDAIYHDKKYITAKVKPEVHISKENLEEFNNFVNGIFMSVDNKIIDKGMWGKLIKINVLDDMLNIVNSCIHYSFNHVNKELLKESKGDKLNSIDYIILNNMPDYSVRIYFNVGLAKNRINDYLYKRFGI